MKRKLTQIMLMNGKTVEAVKDCDCLPELHTGPHWIYDDELWQERNKKLLMNNPTQLSCYAFAKEEEARLQVKAYTMQAYGIIGLIYDDAPQHPLHPTGGNVAAESEVEKPASG